MKAASLLVAAAAVVLALAGLLAWLLPALARQQRVEARLAALRPAAPRTGLAARPLPVRLAVGLGTLLMRQRMVPRETLAAWSRMLVAGNFRSEHALALLVGAKGALMLGLPPLALLGMEALGLDSTLQWGGAALAAILGLLLPDALISRLRRTRLQAVERGLPDALDMLVICAEAGLGMEAAIDRVAREIGPAHRAVAEEFATTASELRILADRRAALLGLGARMELEPLRRLAATLVQTMQYGTPLTQALRTLAAELRQEQLLRFETRAARMPVLLTVPMVAFILPTIFLVLAAPAVIQVARAL